MAQPVVYSNIISQLTCTAEKYRDLSSPPTCKINKIAYSATSIYKKKRKQIVQSFK